MEPRETCRTCGVALKTQDMDPDEQRCDACYAKLQAWLDDSDPGGPTEYKPRRNGLK